MTDDDTRKRKTPAHLSQKGHPITVGDEVKTRYTSDYWPTKVRVIADDSMTVHLQNPDRRQVGSSVIAGDRPDADADRREHM